MSERGVLLGLLTTLPVLAGCLGGDAPDLDIEDTLNEYLPMEEAVFNTTGSWSQTLLPGVFERLDPIIQLVESFDGTRIEVGIHRPLIPGCPTEDTADYPEECKTPVLVDAGPYYSPETITELSTRPPSAIWFVPHGYTVAYVSVRGTSGSGGCMQFMSLNEQKDVDAMVTYLAERPWSTGNVGMIGRSYDGTTPFMAAALGNPHLKTIVPISGVADGGELMFSNGTSELRGPIMHNYVYWLTFGLGAEPMSSAASQVCFFFNDAAPTGIYTSQTGDQSVAGQDDYWEVRNFRDRVLQNYKGSLYIVHGMQDWNVNPRMVVPWINELQDQGFKVKAWLGQWAHAYPDRADEHPNVRWDWAETLLRWFDSELKGVDVDTGPVIEVEDHRHQWWVMDSYPARDLEWTTLNLNGDGTMTTTATSSKMFVLGQSGGALNDVGGVVATVEAVTGQPAPARPAQSLSLVSEPFEGPIRVSGLVQLPLKVTPTTPTGANLYVDLYDVYPDFRQVWIGHGWMNLKYHDATGAMKPLVPGQAVTAKMQFEPLEAYLSEGHRLRLNIAYDVDPERQLYGNSDVLPHPDGGPVIVHLDGASQLKVPLLDDFLPSVYQS